MITTREDRTGVSYGLVRRGLEKMNRDPHSAIALQIKNNYI